MLQILGLEAIEGFCPNELDLFIDQLYDSDEPVINSCVRYGLPPEGAAVLAFGRSIVCPGCNFRLNAVPCVACNQVESDTGLGEESVQAKLHNKRLYRPANPTKEKPGTSGKLLVMQERIARGESPFHPNDPRVSDDKNTDEDTVDAATNLSKFTPDTLKEVLLRGVLDESI